MCKKCVEACPTKAIHAVNFPAPKPKPVVEKAPETSEKPDITAKVETKEKEAQA
jgi:ferredoxin